MNCKEDINLETICKKIFISKAQLNRNFCQHTGYIVWKYLKLAKKTAQSEKRPYKRMIKHPINPLYDKNSKILILGSFPSVKSREQLFFYGHPQNRFWKVVSAVFEQPEPKNIAEKRELLLSNGIAVWDVIASCDIVGSSDSSIKNVVPNDLSLILKSADIKQIFTNGKTAEKYYNKYLRSKLCREAICLPSTSPANAAWTLERLTEEWRIIKVN